MRNKRSAATSVTPSPSTIVSPSTRAKAQAVIAQLTTLIGSEPLVFVEFSLVTAKWFEGRLSITYHLWEKDHAFVLEVKSNDCAYAVVYESHSWPKALQALREELGCES